VRRNEPVLSSRSQIGDAYAERTSKSQALMTRAAKGMPGGSTRSFGWHEPYPLVMERGDGPYLWDVDGNRYVDLVYNGLSLIHGHAFPPVVAALGAVLARGSAWPGASMEQIEFAEALLDRVNSADLVRFTNTGTEAGMLAVKIARRATGRPLVLKAWAGYHGSYDDLEAGLAGQGPIPGRTALADFGSVQSFERALTTYGPEVAAVVLEPVMYTGVVTPPPPGFLKEVQAMARRHGALFVLDDCLMFRLAEGGSAEKFGLDPDITFLGKFIGGGLPVGVVAGKKDVMGHLDPRHNQPMYHGGSFNGNLLGSVAGKIGLRHLTGDAIAKMDRQAERIHAALDEKASELDLPLVVSREGSVMGIYLESELPSPRQHPDAGRAGLFHLACLNHGLFPGSAGEVAMATVISDEDVEVVIAGFGAALEDVSTTLSSLR
jgi:glutamate-1-semialdehyde 2,1-aminomutase